MDEVILTFKTPDVMDQLGPEVSEADKEWISSYIKWGEYISVRFDLIHGTVEVVKS